jgi:hypothetical protein
VRSISLAVWIVLAFAAGFSPALAEKRVALVIGNGAYQNVPKLPNPANDAMAIARMLQAGGFDAVELHANLTIRQLRQAINDFADMAKDADIAVVYYSGHGIEVNGMNYLIPVDAVLTRDTDVPYETFSLENLLQVLESTRQLRLVMLDACRDNPFARSMKRTTAARSLSRGLAAVEPTTVNTVIGFAAKAGSVALDGDGSNSPYAIAVLNHLATPGLDLRLAFGRVRDDVLKVTKNKQEPFLYGSLGGTTVALVPAVADQSSQPNITTPPPARSFTADVRRDYELTKEIGTKRAWEAFLANYPVGMYADLAREQLAKLNAAEDANKPKGAPPDAAKPPAQATQPQRPGTKSTDTPKQGGYIACDSGGCREFKPGCRVVPRGQGEVIVCN